MRPFVDADLLVPVVGEQNLDQLLELLADNWLIGKG